MKLDLRKSLFILPNLLTLSSIFCGFLSMVIATSGSGAGVTSEEDFYRAALLIVFAAVFDIFDGRVARLTKTQSEFGTQIDSLADVLSFGAAPALLVYRWSLHTFGFAGVLAAFVYLACGTIRLARFNVLSMSNSMSKSAPKQPGKYIVGLPIPAAAAMVVSIVVANFAVTGSLRSAPELMLAMVLALSLLMVSTVPFRSFKEIKPTWATLLVALGTLGATVAIAILLHPAFALVWLIVAYVALALVEGTLDLSRRAAALARSAPRTSPSAGGDSPGLRSEDDLRRSDEDRA